MVSNIISIDFENWYSGKDIFKGFSPEGKVSQLDKSIPPLLDLLDKYGTKATFFVLGESAEKEPGIVKEIFNRGHEIASHGYRHISMSKLGKWEFEKDIKKSVMLIEKITGKKPMGFRAPIFSLNDSTKWALPILEKYGFKYDSSVFPFRSKYYGVEGVGGDPYRVNFQDLREEDKDSSIVEYPIRINKILGIPFIITGGFYLRLYPIYFIKQMIKHYNNNGKKVILYFHPWETYKDTPKVKMNGFSKFVTYHNIKSCFSRIEKLLNSFEFGSF